MKEHSAPGGGAPYQLARDGKASPEVVTDKLVKALTKNLRDAGGIPGWPEMTQTITDCVPEEILASYEALDRLVREHNGHRHAKIAADVAKSLIVQSLSGTAGMDGDISNQFAERVCEAIIDNGLFAKAGTRLVEEGRFSNLQEFREWQGKIERMIEPSVAKIAGNLVQKTGRKEPSRSKSHVEEEDHQRPAGRKPPIHLTRFEADAMNYDYDFSNELAPIGSEDNYWLGR